MKSLLQFAALSITSAFLGAFIYSTWFQPNPAVVSAPVQAKQVKVDTYRYERSNPPRQWLSSSPTDFTDASKFATPAVVFIETRADQGYNFWMGQQFGSGSGSGVIISDDGYIVTNNHVISEADEVMVMLNDNREYTADLVGTDPTTDLALLKIEAEGLPFLRFGNSDSLLIGEWVLAVGNPFKLQSTVTAGIISAMGRNINILNNQQYSIESFIQTDAVVNPGNSGGALVNTNGELIGINTAILTQTGQYEGYSFAVPSNLANKVVNDLKEFGTVQRGLLGVQISDVTARLAKELDLPTISGVYIGGVFPQGGAGEAGMQTGDVIYEVNGVSTPSVPRLQEQVARFRPGDKIDIAFYRDGKKSHTTVLLKNQINSTEPIVVRRDEILEKMGIEVRNLSTEERNKLDVDGVKVLSIERGSLIDKINMIPEYIVTHVNGQRVRNADEMVMAIEEAPDEVKLEGFYEKYRGDFPYSFEKSDLPD
jgi:Do/DeqQ family serine protease